MPRKRIFLLLLITSLFLFSCRESEEPVKVSLDKRQEITFRPQSPAITYAYLPQYSNTESFQRHHRLVEYLSEQTGLPIRQVFPETFDNYISMFGQGKIDISFSNPFIYVKLANRYGAKAMARIVETNGRAEFRGQIIARKDNKNIQSIEDCRGKSWVAVDPSSAGGYLFPLGLFIDHGIVFKRFQGSRLCRWKTGKCYSGSVCRTSRHRHNTRRISQCSERQNRYQPDKGDCQFRLVSGMGLCL